jgi:prevent-host-death family protein
MLIVNMHAAKSQLSKLVEAAISGEEVIIARNGRPTVKLVPVDRREVSKRIGGGLSFFTQERVNQIQSMSLEDFSASDDEIADMFYGKGT